MDIDLEIDIYEDEEVLGFTVYGWVLFYYWINWVFEVFCK